MRLAVRFSPTENIQAGSQITVAQNLIPALYELCPNMVLFTSSPELFSHIFGLKVCKVRKVGVSRSIFGAIKERILDCLTFELKLRKHKCNVVYYPYTNEMVLLTFTVPQVITVHDVIPLIFQDMFPLMSKQWKFFTIPVLRFSERIIVVSNSTKKDLVRLSGIDERKISVVPGGFRSWCRRRKVRPNNYGRYLLYVSSSQYPYKNILRLLKAFAKLKSAISHNLLIVGKKYARDGNKTIEAARQMGLEDRVFFLEDLTNSELHNIYSCADLFVYPSLYEGFGIPPLEAMDCGVPVIASQAASIPEVCGEAAYYFDPSSVDAIADAIKSGLFDYQLRKQLIDKGLERVKKFGWDRTAARVLEICKDVLK